MGIAELRQQTINYCGKDLIWFVENFGHYEDKDADELVQPFRLWKEQKAALLEFENNRLNIVLKARQLGFTWLAINYAARLMLCRPGRTVLGMSRSEDEAKELIRRMDVVLGAMPELILRKGDKDCTELYKRHSPWYETTALSVTIHFAGSKPDSVMQCFASSGDAGRSFTADLFLIDEWAAQANARDIWGSIFPTINRPTGGQLIGISTIQRGTLFEELFEQDNSFHKIFIPWYADPKRTQEWYNETKKNIGDVLMAQEYPATVEEAMSVPGGAFFPEVIDSSILTHDPLKQNLVTYFVMDYGLDKLAGYFFTRDAFGNFQIISEIYESDMTVGAAAATILEIAKDYGRIEQFLAPPDLWNRSPQTGKSIAILFGEFGVNLTKVNNDKAAGCLALKELLKHGEDQKSKLTILDDCAPNLLRCLKKIQHDNRKPNIYANQPHELTHAVDAVRYLAIYWTTGASNTGPGENPIKWRPDMYEDYENASLEDRVKLIERWGEPN